MSPEAPVTAIFIPAALLDLAGTASGLERAAGTPASRRPRCRTASRSGQAELALELTGLEALPHGGEEASGVRAVRTLSGRSSV